MKTQAQNHERRDKIKIAGEGEKAQYLVHEKNDNTVRFALHYPHRLSAELLERATGAVVRGIDILHASFEAKALEGVWVVHEDVAAEDYFTLLETKEDTMAVADHVLIKPVLFDEKAQMHCTLIQGEADSVLVLRISHLCVDGGDGKYLLGKLVEAYNLLAQEGNAKRLELKNGSRSVFQIYKGLPLKERIAAVKPTMPTENTVFPFPEEEAVIRRW